MARSIATSTIYYIGQWHTSFHQEYIWDYNWVKLPLQEIATHVAPRHILMTQISQTLPSKFNVIDYIEIKWNRKAHFELINVET